MTNMGDRCIATGKRLFSLDALRGLDMILLTVVAPLVSAAQRGWTCFPDAVMRQFSHYWGGFTLYDIIMPLFIFMCGAAIPLALAKRLEKGGGYWRHVLGRVALLWFLGGLVQGDWATLNPLSVSPFSNTLQSIAVGYLAVAAALYARRGWLMVAFPLVCAAAYTIALAAYGDYTPFGNLAYKVDSAILKTVLPVDSRWVKQPSDYTWFLTSLMFAAMAFAGCHATRILQSARGEWRGAAGLVAYGAALLAVGGVALVWIPCIKHVYTLSFTALAMGACALLLAALYVVNDVLGCRRGWGAAVFFGRNALAAYFASHFFWNVLSAGADCIGGGVVARLPESAHPFARQVFFTVCLVAVLVLWRRARTAKRA